MGAGMSGVLWTLLNPAELYQSHPPQTRMPASADDNVIVHGDSERFCDVDDRFRHLDVGLRGRGIAGGVVVHEPAASIIYLSLLLF
ncbi:hypothetical protein AB7M17_002228 [Bradyrhizobium sp. USDA 377]